MSQTPDLLEGFELSPQQARLWHWLHMHGADAATPATLILTSAQGFNRTRAEASLAALTERHEILRTSYQKLPGMTLPVQVIGTAPAYSLAFDGEQRATLTLPALNADVASLARLAEQWAAGYLDGAQPEEPLQYADYAAWRGEAADEEGLRFWNRLPQAPAVPLPLRRAAPAGWPARAQLPLTLSTTVQAAWQTAAATLGVDTASLALAAWVTLWHRHSEADQLTIGYDEAPAGGPLADALGLFGEPLPLTIEALDNVNFAELCRTLAARRTALADWRDSHPSAAAHTPFALGFRLLPSEPASALARASWKIEHLDSPSAPYQLLLDCHADTLTLHYNPTLYSSELASELAEQFAAILEHGCREPPRALATLNTCGTAALDYQLDQAVAPALSAEQQQRYNAIAALPTLAACFALPHEAERPAVAGPSGELSYAELAARADALAQRLLARGITPGTRVAHFLPRDLNAIVALVAIVKAGACYVPVDPSYPQSRIDYILQDSQAELVLSDAAHIERLPAARQARALDVTANEPAPAPQAWPAIAPSQCAYLIYTSGSTGQPKGVAISHANALASLAARVAYYPQPVERFLLLSSFAFDSSIAGLFWSLAQGGCLHLASEAEQKDPAQLAALIRAHGVSHLLALPSLYALLLEALGTAAPSLNTVIVAGEACPPALPATHAARQPQARLYNEYGPTEASVWSTVAECRAADDNTGNGQPVPIGRAIPGYRVYLLDAAGAPVARGIKGELYIGGPGLSAGYLNRPEFTAERFVSTPHPALAGARLYRTGDYAYLNQDGQWVFAGRADAQIKLRGYRIELGEIEAALRTASGAAHAVALLDTNDGEPRLRAFIETAAFIESAVTLDTAALRATLAARLPEYMVPADIQALAALPRTANGKTDHAALLALKPASARPPYTAPQGHVEQVLATLWAELLGLHPVGRDDDFFALGGHSLLVVKLVHRIRASLHRDAPVSAVFQHPTVAALAAYLATGNANAPLIVLKPGEPGLAPLYCFDPGEALHHYLPLATQAPIPRPLYGLALPFDPANTAATLPELAARHAAMLLQRQTGGPFHLCGWSMGGLLALETARQLEAAGATVAPIILLDTTFHPNDEPLSRAELFAALEQELSDEGRARLERLPAAELDALAAASAGLGKVDQLQLALLEWPARHGLELAAPRAYVEAELVTMRTTRRWLAGYQPPHVRAELQLVWAEHTLATRPALPAQWEAVANTVRHHRVTGDHETMLAEPALARLLQTLLENAQDSALAPEPTV